MPEAALQAILHMSGLSLDGYNTDFDTMVPTITRVLFYIFSIKGTVVAANCHVSYGQQFW